MAEFTRSFSDPIHGFIKFNKRDPLEKLALDLIDTRAFQRLRNIKQLGVTSIVYPSATHSRFTHSIGTFFVAREMCDLIKNQGFEDKDKRDATLIAALLHDIGHGPYSHIFELLIKKATGFDKKHEYWSAEIITKHHEVFSLLENYKKGFSRRIAEYITMSKDDRDVYSSIISGAFDADRLDYMMRDRMMCGISGSAVDKSRIMNSLEVFRHPDYKKLYFGLRTNALLAVEEFISSRVNLYYQIYLHKREYTYTLALSNLFKILIKKKHLLDDQYSAFENLLKGDINLENYLETTDADVERLTQRMLKSSDKEATLAAQRVLDRYSYECIEITTSLSSRSKEITEKISKIKDILKDVKGAAFEDYTIKGYNPKDKELPIYIIDSKDTKKVFELSEISESSIHKLSKRIFRAYMPKEYYSRAKQALYGNYELL